MEKYHLLYSDNLESAGARFERQSVSSADQCNNKTRSNEGTSEIFMGELNSRFDGLGFYPSQCSISPEG